MLDVIASVVHDLVERSIVRESILHLLGIINVSHLICQAVMLSNEVHSGHMDALSQEGSAEEVDERAWAGQVPGRSKV